MLPPLYNEILFSLCKWGVKKINGNIVPLYQKHTFVVNFFTPKLHNKNKIPLCKFLKAIFKIWLKCTHTCSAITKLVVLLGKLVMSIAIPLKICSIQPYGALEREFGNLGYLGHEGYVHHLAFFLPTPPKRLKHTKLPLHLTT